MAGKIAFTINGNKIYGSFWQQVVNACKGDKYEAGRLFWRARNKKNVGNYIRDGLKRKWIFTASLEEESLKQSDLQDWCDTHIFNIGAPKRDSSIKGELKKQLMDLANSL